jgi:hypothetical protein
MKSALLKSTYKSKCKYYRFWRFADRTSYSFLKSVNIIVKLERSIEAVIGVCEGRFFERLAGAMGAAQKVVLEQTPSALAGAAVLHNVIIVHP